MYLDDQQTDERSDRQTMGRQKHLFLEVNFENNITILLFYLFGWRQDYSVGKLEDSSQRRKRIQ